MTSIDRQLLANSDGLPIYATVISDGQIDIWDRVELLDDVSIKPQLIRPRQSC